MSKTTVIYFFTNCNVSLQMLPTLLNHLMLLDWTPQREEMHWTSVKMDICCHVFLGLCKLFNKIQWSLTYPNLTYREYSLSQTRIWELIHIPIQEVFHLFTYPVGQLANRGVRRFHLTCLILLIMNIFNSKLFYCNISCTNG